jgi:acyl-homoserine lactone synthase
MALLVEPAMHGFFRAQLDDMFQLRHRILVERLGWSDMAKPDGRERDQYDTENATYFLTFGTNGEVTGCSRLNPSTGPNLTMHTFGDKATFQNIPFGPDVMEYSRFCVDIENFDADGCNAIKADQITSIVDYCARRGVGSLIAFTLTHTMPQYVAAGAEVRPLGLPVDMDGTSFVSAQLVLSPQSLAQCLKLFGLAESPLIDPANAEPDELANYG